MCIDMSEMSKEDAITQVSIQQAIHTQESIIEEPKYNLTPEEREMLAGLVFTEANTESLECQKAIVSVVINRWENGYWGNTLYDVIYAKHQFAAAHKIKTVTPTANNYEAVDYVLMNGCTLPKYVLYFRANYHFKWHGYVPYTSIDHTYFGYIDKDKK
jgi:spore germination cell wall hydrolase CwlJ-like protein